MDNKHNSTSSELYPELSQEEREQAKQNLRAYIAVVKRIFDRLER